MATILADVATIAADATFKSRVSAAIAYKANFIGSAILDGTDVAAGTALGKQRLILAQEVLYGAGMSEWTETFAWAIAALPAIADASADDASILSAVDDLWNLMAGQTTEET